MEGSSLRIGKEGGEVDVRYYWSRRRVLRMCVVSMKSDDNG